MVKDVTDADFTAAVLDRSKERPVIVDFWATWCAPCRQLSPLIERLGAEYADSVDVVKMDVDANPQTASMMGIKSIPTVVAFKDGAPIDGFLGAQPEPTIREFFDRLLPSDDDTLAEAVAVLPDAEAEPALRDILSRDPGHRGAVLGLSRLLIKRAEFDEARALLARIPADDDVRRLLAEIDIASAAASAPVEDLSALAGPAATDPAARVTYGMALAQSRQFDESLEQLLSAVRDGEVEAGRAAMVDVFILLGDDDPRVATYRRLLASALF